MSHVSLSVALLIHWSVHGLRGIHPCFNSEGDISFQDHHPTSYFGTQGIFHFGPNLKTQQEDQKINGRKLLREPVGRGVCAVGSSSASFSERDSSAEVPDVLHTMMTSVIRKLVAGPHGAQHCNAAHKNLLCVKKENIAQVHLLAC